MKYLLIFIFYGLLYFVFEAVFNFITEDLSTNKINWQNKLKLKVSNAPSIWMIPVGSICGFFLHLLFMIPLRQFLLVCVLGGLIITTIEFGSGMILNVLFKLNLWDYSISKIKLFGKDIAINFKGQIDLWHSLGWCGLTSLIYLIDQLFKY